MRKKTDHKPRTIKVRCVTHRTWQLINRLMDEAEQAVPEAHVRKRRQARGAVFKREVTKRAKLREIDPRDHEVYFTRRTNLGTSRWPHVVDDYEGGRCYDFSDKSVFYPSFGRGWRSIDDCVCIYG